MRQELNQIENIEKYLLGKLNPREVANFEAKMLADELLQEQVAAQKLVQQAALRSSIRADVLKYGGGAVGTSGWSLKWFSAWGGGLALLTVLLLGYWWKNESFNKKIVADYARTAQVLQADFPAKTKTENSSSRSNNGSTSTNNTEDKNHDNTSKSIGSNASTPTKHKQTKKNNGANKTYAPAPATYIGGLKTWATPDIQYFEVNPQEGAALECHEGTLLVVPENAFVDENNNTITTTVTLEVVEALSMAEMVGYNLVTMHGDQPLSSGGMIYIQPKSNGKKVNINPERPIYIEIPTENYDPEMMAWESEIDANGDINWKNPKPLEKYLTKIDFANLDFLPDGFANAVAAGMPYKNHQVADDELVDSLYYSFGVIQDYSTNDRGSFLKVGGQQRYPRSMKARKYLGINSLHGRVVDNQGKPINDVTVNVVHMGKDIKKTKMTNRKGKFKFRMVTPATGIVLADKKDSLGKSTNEYKAASVSIPSHYRLGFHQEEILVLKKRKDSANVVNVNPKITYLNIYNSAEGGTTCYINPQSIQTIVSEKFANTFLATKEFEQRLKVLHEMPNAQNLFDKYVNNLNKNLWEVDQMVADRLSGENKKRFQDFASQKLTNVKHESIYQKQLTEYYNTQKKKLIEEKKKRQEKYASKRLEELVVERAKLQSMINEYNRLSRSSTANSSESNTNNYAVNNSGYQSLVGARKPPINLPILSQAKTNVINSTNTYSTTWFKSGWMNIDSYLHALGKNPKDVEIHCSKERKASNKTKIYQCLNSLKAVIPLVILNQIAHAKFPKKHTAEGRLSRSTYCVGLRNNLGNTELAYQEYDPYSTTKISLNWEQVDPRDLIKTLRALPGFNHNIIRDLKAEKKALDEQLKQQNLSKEIKKKQQSLLKEMKVTKEVITDIEKELSLENAFMETLQKVVDKCADYSPATTISPTMDYPQLENDPKGAMPVNFVEARPFYPECENKLDRDQQNECTYQIMRNYIQDNITIPQSVLEGHIVGKVWVKFTVDKTGEITGASLVQGIQPDIDQEVLRVIYSLPKMIPAMQKGKNVSVTYQIPVQINIQ